MNSFAKKYIYSRKCCGTCRAGKRLDTDTVKCVKDGLWYKTWHNVNCLSWEGTVVNG